MERRDAWCKIKNETNVLESLIQIIHNRGFVVSNLRLHRTLDELSYHINMEVEGDRSFQGLSEQIAAAQGVEKIEIRPDCAKPAIPRLADIGE